MPPLIYEMFPQEYLDLQKEIAHHPALIDNLQKHNGDPHLDVRVFECAVYCNILLGDPETGGFGEYSPESIAKLAGICCERLKAMRGGLPGLAIIHELPKDLQ